MSEDPSKRTPPPISSADPRRVTGKYTSQEKDTVEMQAAPSWAVSMQESINHQFTLVNAHLDLQDNAVENIQRRVADLEAAQGKRQTGPQKTYSGEMHRISENDLSQDAAIAKLLTQQSATDAKVVALIDSQATQTAMQVDIQSAVTGWVKQHPEVTNGAATLLGVIITLLTAWFQSKVHP